MLCSRGQSWNYSGYDDQDGGAGTIGVSVPPKYSELMEWVTLSLTGLCGGPRRRGIYRGGWGLERSVVVIFPRGRFFYKAGDEFHYDLKIRQNRTYSHQQRLMDVRKVLRDLRKVCWCVLDRFTKFLPIRVRGKKRNIIFAKLRVILNDALLVKAESAEAQN